MVRIDWLATNGESERVRRLLRAVSDVDGRPEVAADGPLPRELRGGAAALAFDDGTPVGYLHLDPDGDGFGRQVGELYVHPDHRGHGVGGALVRELVRRAGVREGRGDRLRVWSHGNHPAAAALAVRHDFTAVRQLHQMRLPMAGVALAVPRLPEGVVLRTFRIAADEDAVARVNAHAFDWHPEQGTLTAADITAAEGEADFDADGFFLAESDGKLLGFHWTKVHPDGTGEVYVVGVDPAAQGGGLGKALTLAGLRYLVERGVPEVLLYVESDNPAAIAVYRKIGFTTADVDVQYTR